MSEFNVRNESIDVERIMEKIRRRIDKKRVEDFTDEQIRELAKVKFESLLNPEYVRSNMLEYYQRRLKEKRDTLRESSQPSPSFEFDPDIIYRSSRGFAGRVLYAFRRLVNPLLKLFFNPAPIVHALTMQQQINERQAEVISQMVRTQTEFIEIAALNYEVMNNLVEEMPRLSIEMKNHKMRVESVAGRMDFDERRARSTENLPQHRENRNGTAGRSSGSLPPKTADGTGSPEPRKRRRRRGRRRPTGSSTSESGNSASAEIVSKQSDKPNGPTQPSVSSHPSDSSNSTAQTGAGPHGDSDADTVSAKSGKAAPSVNSQEPTDQ